MQDQGMLAALAAYFGNAGNNPASPLHRILDKAAGVVAGPAIDAYQGMQRVWGANGEEYIPVEDINRTAQNIAEFAAYGSMPGKAAAVRKPAAMPPAETPASAPQAQKVYHLGKVPKGGQFDPAKSSYGGDVFVGGSRFEADNAASYGPRHGARMHELNLSPDARLFDPDNPQHVDAAMQWWDQTIGQKQSPEARKALLGDLRDGEFNSVEPGGSKIYNVNPFIRENFDGYYMREIAGAPKNIGMHNPGHLTHPDGTTFFSNNQNAAGAGQVLNMSHEARIARAKEMGFDTDTTWRHFSDKANDIESFDPNLIGTARPGHSAPAGFHFLKEGNDHLGHHYGSGSVDAYLPANLKDVDAGTQSAAHFFDDNYDALKKLAEESGTPGLRVRGAYGTEQAVVFDPSKIRRTDAAFDPSQGNSGNLLASDPMMAALFALQNMPAYEPTPEDF